MNVSFPQIHIQHIPPVVEEIGQEFLKAFAFLLIPAVLLYFTVYSHLKRRATLYNVLTFITLALFWSSSIVTPVSCGPMKCLQNFAVATGSLKTLDLFARRNQLPMYKVIAGSPPSDPYLALLLVTELRYESFTPNHIRIPQFLEKFNEPLQLGIHLAVFVVLQSLPQIYPTVLAFEVLLAIYIIWTSLQLVLRYKTSPALFGPLYMADSLTGFWSETWHNAFASPCVSLAYTPIRNILAQYGVSNGLARSLGVLGSFTLMAIYHVYALLPMLNNDAVLRIGLFFVLNGVATVAEAAIWGRKRHWAKTLLAWIFETSIATWVASGINIPNGLSKIPWRDVC